MADQLCPQPHLLGDPAGEHHDEDAPDGEDAHGGADQDDQRGRTHLVNLPHYVPSGDDGDADLQRRGDGGGEGRSRNGEPWGLLTRGNLFRLRKKEST